MLCLSTHDGEYKLNISPTAAEILNWADMAGLCSECHQIHPDEGAGVSLVQVENVLRALRYKQ